MLLNVDAAAHDLRRNTNRVQFTHNRPWWHPSVHLLHDDVVGSNVTRLGSPAGFGGLEIGEHFEGVLAAGRNKRGLNGAVKKILEGVEVSSGVGPSKAHQLLLGNTDFHVLTKRLPHPNH